MISLLIREQIYLIEITNINKNLLINIYHRNLFFQEKKQNNKYSNLDNKEPSTI